MEPSGLDRVIASSVGGLLTALVMTPLDVVKIRMQSHGISGQKCFVYCNGLMEHLCTCPPTPMTTGRIPWYRRPGNFMGTWVGYHTGRQAALTSYCVYHSGNQFDGLLTHRFIGLSDAVHKIVRNEGVCSLWSGLSPTLIMALPQTVVYFTLNDWLKEYVGYSSTFSVEATGPNQKIKLTSNDWIPAVIGGVSRVFAVAVISPLELLRTKMQAVHVTPAQPIQSVLGAVRQDGIFSLWTGMGPTLLRDVPYSMLFWLVFDYFKSRHQSGKLSGTCICSPKRPDLDGLTFGHTFVYGAAAGLVAGVLTHPFDVIKTRRQVELGEAIVSGQRYPKSSWLSLHRVYTTDGVRALFSGFTPRLMKTTTASAIMIATFETLKKSFAGTSDDS
ncbi:unnamed protein product [Dicrocoelium dendriticum]|nr:unnamed protein product [Dicrocoelium dendriticum]